MSLDICRNNIDAIDTEIRSLLDRRIDVVKKIAAIKMRANLPLIDPKREAEVIRRIASNGTHRSRDAVATVFREIISQSRQIQAAELGRNGDREKLHRSISEAHSKPQMSSPQTLATRDPNAKSIIWVGDVPIGGTDAVIIAGPCSVESREQIFETAMAVKNCGAAILRGGAYKPRTSPYDFQGLGRKGLELLREAGDAAGLPVVTEVMSEDDVELISDTADMLQLGARNMQNFALLKKVAKSNKPVLLKRGAAATVREWLSAAEYLLHGGNGNVVLCERGVKGIDPTLRNNLDLASVALVKELTHLPVIVDPSHATGRRSLISATSKAAIAVGADGIIVEVHPDPETALSDKEQQLTFQDFADLMNNLISPLPDIYQPAESSWRHLNSAVTA